MEKSDQETPDFGTYLLWGLMGGIILGVLIEDYGLGISLGLLAGSLFYYQKLRDSGHEISSKKLYRSSDDRMIAGVCGGMAEYFDVKPSLVRIVFVIFTLVTGIFVGGLLYLLLAILVPEESSRDNTY
ncbi:MAG: phage shock protein PspC [Methanolobus sp. T82-4]|jgi:phage shock protein C|nr:PspC domain-containing protein [Methanolobus zinderi]KXS43572.1 MAG: phage shock protein PspC [Methanolobus sp. T82-4]